jgi:hypothetical protein
MTRRNTNLIHEDIIFEILFSSPLKGKYPKGDGVSDILKIRLPTKYCSLSKIYQSLLPKGSSALFKIYADQSSSPLKGKYPKGNGVSIILKISLYTKYCSLSKIYQSLLPKGSSALFKIYADQSSSPLKGKYPKGDGVSIILKIRFICEVL